jgi:uncharacterized membrane protein YbaN (DUF454 family)
MRRQLWIAAGCTSVALGAAGVVLPLLPTTPFVLLAAWCFARSSPRLHDWLLAHRLFGPLIANWRQHRAISRSAKRASLLSMAAVLGLSWAFGVDWHLLAIQAGVLACTATFILTRPDGPR